MLGAILGDMVGAPFEFDRGNKTKDFEMFGKGVGFTDDSVMTIAVAEAMLDSKGKSDDEVKKALVSSMQKWGHEYPNAGYGGMFYQWLRDKNPKPYGSFGNGSAMRVSSVGWLFLTMEETRKYARLSAEVTHNHPEGIKGAEATAACIFLARHKASKEQIKDYVIREFGYDLSRTCDEIRPTYHHVETCQETVPEAITAFLEGEDFEDVIRTAVSLGGDCDTLTCIAGGITEAFYGVPDAMVDKELTYLPQDMMDVISRFMAEIYIPVLKSVEQVEDKDFFKKAVEICQLNRNTLNMLRLFQILRDNTVVVPCTAVPSEQDQMRMEEMINKAMESGDLESMVGQEFTSLDDIRMIPDILQNGEDYYFPIFTSVEEMGDYGNQFSKVEMSALEAMNLARNNEKEVFGFVLNAFTTPVEISKDAFDYIEQIESIHKLPGA